MSKSTSIVTTVFGFLGGTTKATAKIVASHSMESIDYVKMIVAAIISASVGYLVKLLFDAIVNAIKNRKKQK